MPKPRITSKGDATALTTACMSVSRALYCIRSRPTNAELIEEKIAWKIIAIEASLTKTPISDLFTAYVAK